MQSDSYVHYDTNNVKKKKGFYTLNIVTDLMKNQVMFTFYNKEIICVGPFDWNVTKVNKIQTISYFHT